jgi:hypothetical protein
MVNWFHSAKKIKKMYNSATIFDKNTNICYTTYFHWRTAETLKYAPKNGLCQTNQAIHVLFLYIVLHFWKIELTLHSNSKGVSDTRPAGATRSVHAPEFPPYYISLRIFISIHPWQQA